MADNVIKFPGLRKLLDVVQAPGRWADEHGAAEAREGLAKPFLPSVKADHPELSDEQAMQEARKYSGMAEQGGMTIGSINNIAQPIENAGAAASKQILDAEHARRIQLIKEMALKNKPQWGN